MKRLLVVLVFLVVAPSAHADWFHTLVGYKCNQATQRLVVYYVGAYNEDGESMVQHKTANEWAPSSLVTMRDEDHYGESRSVARTCDLKHGSYEIKLGPSPGNANVQGQCGAHVSAWVSIKRNGEIVGNYTFDEDCHAKEVLVRVTIDGSTAAPRLKHVSRNSFLGWDELGT
jgi:hypothetical protein